MYKVYQVLPGEELENIAFKLNIEMEVLKELNGLDEDYRALPGNQLVVPNVDDSNFRRYTIKKGDTLYEIGKKYQIDTALLAMINGLDMGEFIYPGEILLIPSPMISFHLTKENDTLKSISKKYDVSVEKLIQENENIYVLPDQLIVLKKEKFM